MHNKMRARFSFIVTLNSKNVKISFLCTVTEHFRKNRKEKLVMVLLLHQKRENKKRVQAKMYCLP